MHPPNTTHSGDTVAFAVTTRSRLKSPRFFPHMIRANARIKRQLSSTPGSVRFASVVMSPKEFWTISVWSSRHAMQEFMRSGAHQDFMWRFSHWFDSFWLMRWSPTEEEFGSWSGASLATQMPPDAVVARSSEQDAILQAAFGGMPRLLTAVGPSGAPASYFAPEARRHRRRVAGGIGGILRIEIPNPSHAPAVWSQLWRLRRELLESDALGCAIGPASATEFFALVLFRGEAPWKGLLASGRMMEIMRRWPGRVWSMRWNAEHEFGHWDGLRMRRTRLEAPSS